MADTPIYPSNDFSEIVTLKTVDQTTGRAVNLVDGTVTAFLATDKLPTSVAADDTLSVDCVYTGSNGKWLVQFDAAVLTPALMDTLFSDTQPYLIVVQPNGVRGYQPLEYVPSRPMTVVA